MSLDPKSTRVGLAVVFRSEEIVLSYRGEQMLSAILKRELRLEFRFARIIVAR